MVQKAAVKINKVGDEIWSNGEKIGEACKIVGM